MKILKPVLCLFILALCSIMPLAISDVIGREGTAIVIKSQEISAYNDVAAGFQRDCQNNTINVKAVYDLKGDIEKGTNIYAISSGVPYTEQFAVFKKLFNTRKNIGILYDPIKTERIVSELTSLGNTYGCNFITEKVFSKKDVGDALEAVSKKIDVLWIVPDDTVISKESIDQFVETSRKNRLPIFCTSSALIKLGALISISPDYYSMGEQAARIARELLRNPSQNPPHIEPPEKLKITINTNFTQNRGVMRN